MENKSTPELPEKRRSTERISDNGKSIEITINISDTVPLSLYRELEGRAYSRFKEAQEKENLLAEKEIEIQALRTKIAQLQWALERVGQGNSAEEILNG